jgi:preprotein translocase subunit SecA
MIRGLARRAFSFRADRRLARYLRTADAVIAGSERHRDLSDEALRDEADALRRKVREKPADDLLVPAFALIREAARRTISETHVREQIAAGVALHEGALVEMKTGEGKTLAAILVAFLNALDGHPVHIATANDHLAGRDAAWMRPIYEALGTSVASIRQDMDDDERRAAYAADVTYASASELGFDHLRDTMRFAESELVQRGLAFVLVDEADAIMIDEASVPLSLFGPLGDRSAHYQAIDRIVAGLDSRHYDTEKARQRVTLTDAGIETVERGLRQTGLLKQASLYDTDAIVLLHHVTQALRAHVLLRRDRDYVVRDGTVIIVDRLTGRLMPTRRYDDGLHQALEAKEGQPIAEESRILASIPFQTLLRSYEKLSGMTGTAAADVEEYREVYGLDTVIIPPHRPSARIDDTVVHASRAERLAAILAQVEDAKARQQPVLVGAPSIERAEAIAELLKSRGWRQHDFSVDVALPRDADGGVAGRTFAVLNARHHAREAQIIAEAGLPGALTIATAMAGRGTDIRLGGAACDDALAARVRAAGGLLVIASEPHDLARIDEQLRGRAGRQGDPGRTSLHLAPDDEPMRVNLGPHRQPDVAKLIGIGQARNASRGFARRLSLARFDQVVELQRRTVLTQRTAIRDMAEPLDIIQQFRDETIDDLIATFAPARAGRDTRGLDASVREILTLAIDIDAFEDSERLRDHIGTVAAQWMDGKLARFGREAISDVLRRVSLALIDQLWAEQSERLDHLKRVIADRRLPPHRILAEFRLEAFASFELMLKELRHEVTAHAMRLGFRGS